MPHPTSCNLHVGDAFDGTYVCGQGQTGVRLEVLEVHGHDVRAAFDFHFDPRGITGRFVLHGTCEGATHRWAMQPERWERQPPGWIMVGMDGTLSADSRQYTGRMTYSACGDFVVARP